MTAETSASSEVSDQLDPVLVPESSVQFMLAEFTRIQEAEAYTRNHGESRFNIYLTLVSLLGAGLVAFWERIVSQGNIPVSVFYAIALIVSIFLSLIGFMTLSNFLHRWRLTVIYLRKLARIRRWFVDMDQSLIPGLVYSTDETKPSFTQKSFFSSSLMTLVVFLNCLTIGTTILFFILLVFPNAEPGLFLSLSAIISIAIWFLQRAHFNKFVRKLEQDKSAAFPLNPYTPQSSLSMKPEKSPSD